jgi:hypothetical protein
MNIRDYVNKRCLLKVTKGYSSDVQEFKIIEVSPSDNWVKLQSNYSGQKFWKQIADIAFVELLQEFESRPTSRAADGASSTEK